MKKSMALILATLQLIVLLAACDTAKTPADTTGTASTTAGAQDTTAPEETKELTEAEKRALVDDELPDDVDLGGRDFVIATLEYTAAEMIAEEQTGVTLNDALYARNNTVETDYGVKIRALVYPDRHQCRAAIQQAMTSGDVEMFDLVAYHFVDNAATAVAGLYQNWHEVPYVDFEKPWWSDSNIEELTVNGKAYMALGDLNLGTITTIYSYLLNKKMAADAGLEDLYQLVRDGKWTIDKVEEICARLYNDVNADGVKDTGDIYGLSTSKGSPFVAYQWAFDVPIVKKDETGTPQFSVNTEKYPDMLVKMVELYNNGTGVWANLSNSKDHIQIFNNGQALLRTGGFGNLPTLVGEVDFEIGVLPYPKWDEEQKEYYSQVGGSAESMGISIVESDEETAIIGLITEALCAESYKQVIPVYYDMMLKNRYADMPDDAEMMDLIVDSRIYDLGFIYDNWQGAGFWMQTLVGANNTNFASFYSSKWPAAEKYYTDKVLALFED